MIFALVYFGIGLALGSINAARFGSTGRQRAWEFTFGLLAWPAFILTLVILWNEQPR